MHLTSSHLISSHLISAAPGIVFKCVVVSLCHQSSPVSLVRKGADGVTNPNSKPETEEEMTSAAGGYDDDDDDDDDHHHHHLCEFIPPGLLCLHLWHRERKPSLNRRPWTVDEPRQSLIVTRRGSACALCPVCSLFPIIDQCRVCIVYRSEAQLHLDESHLEPSIYFFSR